MSTHSVMLKTVVEAYRDGVLVAGPIPYAGHPENAQHLARRTALENRADFVRVLDESGKHEQWSRHLDEQGRPQKSDRDASPPDDDTTSSSANLESQAQSAVPGSKAGAGDQKTQQPNQSGQQDQNKKSQDPSLRTKEERVPDRNVQPGVGSISTGGSSDGTSSVAMTIAWANATGGRS